MKCIECKSEIPDGASLCSTCNSFQSRWKNWLKFWATVVGVFVVLAGLCTYILANIEVIRKTLFWNDKISVLSLDSGRHIAVSNAGDGDVFVSHLTYWVKTNVKRRRTKDRLIGEVLKTGSIQDYKFSDRMVARTGWEVPYGKITPETLKLAHADLEESCFSFGVMTSNDSAFQHLKGVFRDQLTTFPAEAYVEFYSPKTQKTVREKVTVIGILAQNPKCTAKPN